MSVCTYLDILTTKYDEGREAVENLVADAQLGPAQITQAASQYHHDSSPPNALCSVVMLQNFIHYYLT